MHRGFYHPPVVRRGAHPILGYGDAAPGAVPVEGTGFYFDTGGYGWYYDRSTGDITMIASPKSRERLVFDRSHPRWAGIFDKVIKGRTPHTEAEVLAGASKSSTPGKATRGGTPSHRGGPAGTPAPVNADLPGSQSESITDKVWFWPVAILVPTAAVVGGLLFWPKKGKKA